MATGVSETRLLGLGERATGDDEAQGQAEVEPKRKLRMKAKSMNRSAVFIVSVREKLASSAAELILNVGYVDDFVLGA